MSLSDTNSRRTLQSLLPAAALVLLVLVLRVAYLRWFCGYDLIEDEAQYWVWAQYLDWSYYSKGPGVAWAIALSTWLFGDAEWVVRLPTVVMSSLGMFAAAGLARDMAMHVDSHAESGEVRVPPVIASVFAAAAYLIAPTLQAVGFLMTIDGSYVALWAMACWMVWRALILDRGSPWIVAGACVALGFLFKYTMLLVLPGWVLFVLVRRARLKALRPGWMVMGGAVALLGIVPVIIWNAQHDWATVRHLLGHLGIKGGDMAATSVVSSSEGSRDWSPWWSLELIGQQIGMVGPLLILAAWMAWRTIRGGSCVCTVQNIGSNAAKIWPASHEARRDGEWFLLCCAAPILLFYLVVSLIAEPEGNWPMAAYATLLPLAGWAASEAILRRRIELASIQQQSGLGSDPRRVASSIRRVRLLWRIGIGYGLVAAVLIHKADVVADMALQLNKQPVFARIFENVLGREPRDPAGRLRGAKVMAAHVDRLMDDLQQQTGKEPFVVAQHYGRTSQLSYYLRARSRAQADAAAGRNSAAYPAICGMVQTGGRRSQFDIWPHTRMDQLQLLGRPAVIVTSVQPWVVDQWRQLFALVEPIPGGKLQGEQKVDRSAYLGYDYRGPAGLRSASDSVIP